MRKAALVLLVAVAALLPWSLHAEGGPIEIVSASVASEFPEGIRFKLKAKSEKDITQVAVRLRIGQQISGVYDYLQFERGTLVDSELFWRTNTSAKYVPPGTIFTYIFEVQDAEGSTLATEPAEFVYVDSRFKWEEVSEGPVTVAYHGPVRTRAETVLETAVSTVKLMGPLLGADTKEPIRITIYNNVKEMLEALPPGSTTHRRELITEGQAFSEHGVVLVLAGDQLVRGTTGHELVHILTHRAGDSIFRRVPAWLDEGLSEFGNPEPGFSYDIAMDFAIETNRLMPITSADLLPSTPEDVIIFYGEARSIVRFMVGAYGPTNMRLLMARLKSGAGIDGALRELYGVDRLGLENQWREAINAPAYEPPDLAAARPTAVPRPSVSLYTLTPQPEAVAVAGSAPAAEATPAAGEAATPVAQAAPQEAAVAPTTAAPSAPAAEEKPKPGGGGCNARPHGVDRGLDVSAVALLVSLAGLGLRRRMRGRQ